MWSFPWAGLPGLMHYSHHLWKEGKVRGRALIQYLIPFSFVAYHWHPQRRDWTQWCLCQNLTLTSNLVRKTRRRFISSRWGRRLTVSRAVTRITSSWSEPVKRVTHFNCRWFKIRLQICLSPFHEGEILPKEITWDLTSTPSYWCSRDVQSVVHFKLYPFSALGSSVVESNIFRYFVGQAKLHAQIMVRIMYGLSCSFVVLFRLNAKPPSR